MDVINWFNIFTIHLFWALYINVPGIHPLRRWRLSPGTGCDHGCIAGFRFCYSRWCKNTLAKWLGNYIDNEKQTWNRAGVQSADSVPIIFVPDCSLQVKQNNKQMELQSRTMLLLKDTGYWRPLLINTSERLLGLSHQLVGYSLGHIPRPHKRGLW